MTQIKHISYHTTDAYAVGNSLKGFSVPSGPGVSRSTALTGDLASFRHAHRLILSSEVCIYVCVSSVLRRQVMTEVSAALVTVSKWTGRTRHRATLSHTHTHTVTHTHRHTHGHTHSGVCSVTDQRQRGVTHTQRAVSGAGGSASSVQQSVCVCVCVCG